MKFTVYDGSTGRILRWGDVPDDAVQSQAMSAGELVIEGEYRANDHYWNGSQMTALPPRPQFYDWDWTTKAWVPNLAAAQDSKWSEMKAARQNAMQQPLATAYGTFDADPESRDNIVQTAQLMQTQAQSLAPGNQPTQDFTLADNTVVTLTAGQMVEVALLLASQINAAYARGRTVRAAIEAATTPEDVAAITWSTP